MAQTAKEYAGRRSTTGDYCGRVFGTSISVTSIAVSVAAFLLRARRMTTIASNLFFF
jgi:hypothetical protein